MHHFATKRQSLGDEPESGASEDAPNALQKREPLWNDFGDLSGQPKPSHHSENASPVASRHASLKGLDPPELAALYPAARRLNEAVKALKRSVPLQLHSDISTIKTRFCVARKVTKTDPKRSFFFVSFASFQRILLWFVC
jgi:hypothetical protein